MNMSIADEIKALEATLVRLKAEQKSERSVKWQPKGGDWYIVNGGGVVKLATSSESREFGSERATKEQAERACVEMRKFNRLLALRDELCGDEVVDWKDINKEKHHLYFSHNHEEWTVSADFSCENIMPYFTNYDLARKACDMLNSGEVEL